MTISLPAWATRTLVSDQHFAQAYDALTPYERGLIKKHIAHLYSWIGRSPVRSTDTIQELQIGLTVRERCTPAPWVLVVVNEDMVSPAQLVAATIPPLMAGVENIMVARLGIGSPWPFPLLVGMELAGVECAFSAADDQKIVSLARVLLKKNGPGIVLILGDEPALTVGEKLVRDGLSCHVLHQPLIFGVWAESKTQWDLSALRFAHPKGSFQYFGRKTTLPPGFSMGKGRWADFCLSAFHAVYIPRARGEGIMEQFSLSFSPGEEGMWVWPQLSISMFQRRFLGFIDTLQSS